MNTHWKRWIVLGLMTVSFGIIASNANDVQVQSYIVHADSYQFPYKGKEKEFHHKINPGYGSALVFKDMKRDGAIEFYGITDRGPNGDIPTYLKDGQKKSGKFFPTPEFTPTFLQHKNAQTLPNPFRLTYRANPLRANRFQMA